MYVTSNVSNQAKAQSSARVTPSSCYHAAFTVTTQVNAHWQAILRAIALQARQPKWVTIINPPRALNAAQLSLWGINTNQVRVVHRQAGYDDEALIDAALAADTSCAIIAFTATDKPFNYCEQNKQGIARVDPAFIQRH
ncbi:hypothetical protein BZG06_02430 [Salinivibrio kushneri]|uniref:Cell division inhibitor SulA n=1 Tax=Salinivibrio kushneri TaxID=1908198 RepID=A0AB36K861_9GAMM|nr:MULTISPECIES: hypothetical protein [Salinivibrio]ODP97186.1 hypothetical protein BGL48_01870 [Salinivibrio sp. BNH]OOE32769.1 hypothetical protein BZG04_14735 [Salinivibrio kushneri]OOE34107.1 hypothetical protein BZG05_08870 [Salinivibrio kushneri]OOE44367.1 hypothetical protein BZG09_07695 [Salinivibrio kushneri]OOE47554.1 hypothetical protein BZG06_02430 [Salinivibrio kushneri]